MDPGNLIYKTSNTPKVVGALGEDAREVIAAVYRAILDGDVHTVSSPAVAEMEKILENTYRKRPDLLCKAQLTAKDKLFLRRLKEQIKAEGAAAGEASPPDEGEEQ